MRESVELLDLAYTARDLAQDKAHHFESMVGATKAAAAARLLDAEATLDVKVFTSPSRYSNPPPMLDRCPGAHRSRL